MARRIEATPVLRGDDAERLLADLERTVSPKEVARRVAAAERFLAGVTRPKKANGRKNAARRRKG
jgi:hypothetical protein